MVENKPKLHPVTLREVKILPKSAIEIIRKSIESKRNEKISIIDVNSDLFHKKLPSNIYNKQNSTPKKSIKSVDSPSILGDNHPDMKSILQALLTEAKIPQKIWPKVMAEISLVLKIAADTEGNATAILLVILGVAVTLGNGRAAANILMTNGGMPLVTMSGLMLGLFFLGAAADCFGWMRPRKEPEKSTVAESKWADYADIHRYDVAEEPPQDGREQGIYLGRFSDPHGTVNLRYKGGKHLLCLGPPGANKSTGLVVPNLAHLKRSIIVIDPKGELAAITANKRRKLGRVVILNPFGILVDQLPHMTSAGWNPLLQLDPESDDFASDAYAIAEALTDKSGGGNGKFFETSAENLAAALVMWERYTFGDEASLRSLRETVSEPNVYKDKVLVSGFLLTLQLMSSCKHDAIRNAGARLYGRLTDPNSQATSVQDVIDTFMASTRFLDHPLIGADMRESKAIDFGALHEEITTVYLILPAHELVSQAKWLRLFVNIALRELYKHPPKTPKLPPVLFMLDEFGNLGWLSQIETALNLSRGYRIQLWMFLQNLAQLKANYKERWESFFTGAGAVTAFRTGDTETAEQLAKLYGNEERVIHTENDKGTSTTPHAIPLIRPEDIGRLKRSETINLIEPCPMPIKGTAPIYPDTEFAEGLDRNPFFHG